VVGGIYPLLNRLRANVVAPRPDGKRG